MRFSLLSLPLFLLAQPAVAGAESLSHIADDLKTLSDRAESWIPYFQSRADLVMWMTIAVICLGAISTATSTVTALAKGNWTKLVTAVMTIVITASIAIVTGIKAEVLHADQDSYRSIEIGIRQVVELIKQNLKNYEVVLGQSDEPGTAISDADAKEILDKFTTHRTELFKLNDRAQKLEITIQTPLKRPSAAFFWLPEMTTAFASTYQQAQTAPNGYLAWGTGNCDTIYGAREYARYDGRRHLAIQVEPKASAERLDALINAIDGSVTEGRNILSKDSQGRFVIHQTEMSLNSVLVQRSLLRVGNGARPSPSFTAELTLKPGFSGHAEVGSKQTPKGLEGAFIFVFKVDSHGGVTRLQLLEIKVHNDSASGSTRWSFDVMLGGRRAFAIPMRRLEDSGKPTTCKVLDTEKLEGAMDMPNSSAINIKVIGYRPKDL